MSADCLRSEQQNHLQKTVSRITRDDPLLTEPMANVISIVFASTPVPRLQSAVRYARQASAITQTGVAQELLTATFSCVGELPRQTRLRVAKEMVSGSMSQRQISQITRLARATIRDLARARQAAARTGYDE